MKSYPDDENIGDASSVGRSALDREIRAVIVSGLTEPGEGIDFRKVVAFIRDHWLLLAIAGFLGLLAGYSGSYLFPRLYRGEVLIAPVTKDSEQSGISGALSKFGGIAGAVGLNVDDLDAATERALAIMQSRGFLEQFIAENDILPILYPNDANGSATKHTLQDASRRFARDILLVKRDKSSKLITVQVDWRDRDVAAKWANQIVDKLNAVTRELAIEQSDRSLGYLKQEYEKTDSVPLRQSISSVMESQVTTKMMAVTRPQYSFEVLDPARPSDRNKSVSPKRLVLAAAGGFLGVVFGVSWSLSRRTRQ